MAARIGLAMVGWVCFAVAAPACAEVAVDLSGVRPGDGITVQRAGDELTVTWPLGETRGEVGQIALGLNADGPLIKHFGIADATGGVITPVLQGVDPVVFLTVGARVAPAGRPPGMSEFNVFFDSPAKRPFQSHVSKLNLTHARVATRPGRATIVLGRLSAGPFDGSLEIQVFTGTRLIQMEAVLSTQEESRAYVYGAGLVGATNVCDRVSWIDTSDAFHRAAITNTTPDEPRMVRYRTIVAERNQGSVACFPPPHAFFYPRDFTDNQSTVWAGRGHGGLDRSGFGIRQTENGGGNFVPWFNAPPGTQQRLGVFYLITRGNAEAALAEVKRYTHGDRFPDLPGHVTFTSHWHMAVTMAAMKEIAEKPTRSTPDFVKMFKDMNVRVVHLAEFHGDGHPQDPGPVRLAEMRAMFDECRRLSDASLTFLPGEEANVHLGIKKPGQHPGHWLYLFPRPVYWTMTRGADQPFVENDPTLGRVFHVGNAREMVRLVEEEHGLAWTAHPRIKASSWAPDAYKDQDYFRSPLWLGGAWKAMPADLSRPRLGERVLNLLDDMANWGARKYAIGEVDVFKIDHTHELYGHMNVNYLNLDHAPRYEDDWTPVLDALRGGRFFVTTGEILLPRFDVAGKRSGETIAEVPKDRVPVTFSLEWTFPLAFAEVVSGDGSRVFRERIDLSDTSAFGAKTFTRDVELMGRTWARVEAWDVARNGVFSQPVWIGSARR